ncbi:MAG: hypothetical protein HN742_11595 [Lentisphaerae bacterium]|jgi:YD repeat-containing protein|nr:hypothetical protein [Lentisphaerota bacterium]MBT4822356.1 hypothetical protein [Lentisphaerota bacterium]MBT5609891.1 hypothetical protein [Lentisphaerota bacterium]MBT7055085.1 hypothetical protein [Lentisphaerota bacterium]MBT7842511.1 hypothetical protein [Lentisphaerota bacterium]
MMRPWYMAARLSLAFAGLSCVWAAEINVVYNYDMAGRLTRATYNDAVSLSYRYDANGNLLNRQVGEPPVFVEFATISGEGDESTTTVDVALRLSKPADTTIRVDVLPAGGTATPPDGEGSPDFRLPPGSVTFAPGETVAHLQLGIADDSRPEDAESLRLALLTSTDAVAPGVNTRFSYTIRDEDEDEDGLPDDWEESQFGYRDLSHAPDGDPDADGQSNLVEFEAQSDPVGYSWQFTCTVSGAQTPDFTIGMAEGAGDGYDEGLDALTSDPQSNQGYAALVGAGSYDFRQDIRRPARTAVWRLSVRTPAEVGAGISWDPATVPAQGLSLIELDHALKPVEGGVNIDMGQPGSSPVSVGTSRLRNFEIRLGECGMLLSLQPGWTLLSLPFDTTQASLAELFGAPLASQPIWVWTEGQSYEMAQQIRPGEAFWIWVPPEAVDELQELRVTGRRLSALQRTISPGWHLLGSVGLPPYAEKPLAAETSEPAGALGEHLWEWDTGAQIYQNSNRFRPGRGYWGWASQDCGVDLGE